MNWVLIMKLDIFYNIPYSSVTSLHETFLFLSSVIVPIELQFEAALLPDEYKI
jgi:hypothetical protein